MSPLSAVSVLAANTTPNPFTSQAPMFIGLIVIMYFLMIRPQQKQRKEQAARIAALQNGDRVVTTAGLHGIVHHVKEHTVMVKVAEGTILEFDKPAIANVAKKDTAGK
ncbi:preprotein translocase subunit YajC [Luteolibacter pohnpeiensis]|uniref:Sec translocon accessory complex subunit YajC n=1 Tax=Luteolibacter pohnpeiensis TaxID=454153 RepID=A0A934S7S0_9BACT|nr:preprotein translocase subunit YajC [Luteolibacter pohnpeiensis]MBK1881262.1 preprotein translocase subunit YajC [Luteolibacter pohnpeiensis]